MADKDRFGDQLRKKEQAEEDLYAAKRDRELIEKMRRQKVADDEQQARDLARNRCPKCGDALVSRQAYGVTVDGCNACGGMWLDKGEIEAAAEHEKRQGWLTRYLEMIRSD